MHAPNEQVQFTYAHKDQSWFRRQLIRSVEVISGSHHFKRLYLDWVASGAVGNPFEVAIRLLKFRIELGGTPLAKLPQKGGLLLVANHPFGIADGLVLGWLATQLRSDVRILTHSLLCAAPEFRPYLLPVDFGETPDARRRTATTRFLAADLLANGGCVVIFPSGSVATSNRPFSRPAAEMPWHPFVARLAIKDDVSVLPVYFHGQNSFWFHLASHVSYPLRVALLFNETRKRIGRYIPITVGTPMTSYDFAALPRSDIAAALRKQCLDLGNANSTEAFRWPSYIRW
jgi:putative hemolysin